MANILFGIIRHTVKAREGFSLKMEELRGKALRFHLAAHTLWQATTSSQLSKRGDESKAFPLSQASTIWKLS